ncbi:thioesterase family protein [Gordonia amicalis]|uniref:Thioesterase family protein n=1 Tax=Gordonia amicalis TaxID=89053 RepID=A0ABU4DD22_9ACTN|nr:thioesterase family protein [Gordonia amicalis]MDV6307638.1 thioesterase family protein [Gordonia amicalis]MDV7099399.1 thioesterase family protein [Gordonia amicalis]UKO92401.1 acyl-CoA thioesterase [Gordonia amicalis]
MHKPPSGQNSPKDKPDDGDLNDNGYAFVADIPVRWSDMDAFGHINHARMVTLMEEARIAWLLSAGEEYAPLITSAMIVHVDIRYQAQLRHDDSPLLIGMWIKNFRSVDFTIGYEIWGATADPDSRPACVASTQMAVVDVEKHTLRRLSSEEKDYLKAWSRRLVAGR